VRLLFFVFLLLTSASYAQDKMRVLKFSGEAIDKKTKSLAYREEHTVTLDAKGTALKAETRYLSPDGELLGDLISDLTTDRYCPAHIYRDLRTNRESGLTYIRKDLAKVYRIKSAEPKKEAELKLEGERICAQAALFYIPDHWTRLIASLTEHVRFVVPGKLDHFGFRIRDIDHPNRELITFRVDFDNWFFRLFAPSIEVDFDRKERRLREYRGASNILGPNDKVFDVVITYKYE
jgi:hypothetical protein